MLGHQTGLLALFAVLGLASSSLMARPAEREQWYSCEVREAYRLTDRGVLEPGAWGGTIKGSRFTVSRETGQIIGDPVTTEQAASVSVLQRGNSAWAYESVATYRSAETTGLEILRVQQFVDGPTKPFIFYAERRLGQLTGICTEG